MAIDEEIEEISELIPVYYKISADQIQKHCLILPYEENSHFVMEIIDQELWGSAFSEV